MGFQLSKRDLDRMKGLHPDLYKTIVRASQICVVKFMVVEGTRSIDQQKKYVMSGASKTMKSRHLTGHAVDIAPMIDLDNDGDLDVSWLQKHFSPLAVAMKQAAADVGASIEWGYDLWKWDGPHFQLPKSRYP